VTLGLLLVFVHIALMFTAVALAYGGVVFFLVALRNRNYPNVIAIASGSKTMERLIPPMFGLAGIFGVVAAIVNGYNLLAPWLIIAYVLFVVLTVIGALSTGPTIKRIGDALAAAPAGEPTPETAQLIRRFNTIEVFDFFFLFVIIFDMVIKPFS
jgi:uncharacterized membrane protein